MRTNFNTEDVKNIIDEIFNGNMWVSRASKGSIIYENPNSEEITLIDPDDHSRRNDDLAQYLNICFYNWKERLNEVSRAGDFGEWVKSLNYSMNKSYALVEKVDEEATPSQDIDNATIIGRVTFLVQADKLKNLDYYVSKIRNKYMGVPQDIQNSYGDQIKAYIMIGALVYEQEPIMTQLGEVAIVTSNFRISYLTDAQTWSDTKVEISLDNGLNYLEMPITKLTRQNIFTSNPLPTQMRPDLTGFVASSMSTAMTLTFYDFNKELTNRLNDLFYSMPAISVNGVPTTVKDVNVPVFIRLTNNGNVYIYKEMIDNMQKVMTNSDFNISSITTKGWGKISALEGAN